MPKNQSNGIVEFLFSQRSGANNELLIKTNSVGEIAAVFGNSAHFSATILTPGTPLVKTFPVLSAFLPVKEPGIIDLPHINYGKLYIDIQILGEENRETWILLSDVTHEVNQVEDIIQENNNKALKNKTKTNYFALDNPFGNLNLFDVSSFLITKEEEFYPLGTIPSWVEKYFPRLASAKNDVDILKLFPYLEVFLPEARIFWETGEETLLGSDMWIENPTREIEMHLRAFATSKNGNHYLMVRLLDHDDIPISQQTIQKAREHQLLYEKLEKTENELKKLLYYKDKFVSIVSHDLRSPIASVASIAEMLLTDDTLVASMSDFNHEMLQGMKEELTRLLEYNSRLYHWSNLELGNFKLEQEKISVKKLIDSVSQTASSKIEAKNIQYTSDVPEDFEIEVDVSLFTQALNNLIGNAIKFTPENGTIKTGVHHEEGKTQFFVADSGVGMPEKVKNSIFAGVPNESTLGTSGEKGSGLGLDIVKKIMDAHGFTIEVQSEQGKGTTFTITL